MGPESRLTYPETRQHFITVAFAAYAVAKVLLATIV